MNQKNVALNFSKSFSFSRINNFLAFFFVKMYRVRSKDLRSEIMIKQRPETSENIKSNSNGYEKRGVK